MTTQEFLNDPIGFTQTNILLISPGCDTNMPELYKDAVRNFRIVATGIRVAAGNGQVYQLVPAGENANPVIAAYFCPYSENNAWFTMLGNNARFMFTATVDGCTFGIGSDGGNGAVRVGHANFSTIGQKWDRVGQGLERQNSAQRETLKWHLGHWQGTKVNLINPENYVDYTDPSHQAATIFGVRNHLSKWTFYTQKYVDGVQPFVLKGVDSYVPLL